MSEPVYNSAADAAALFATRRRNLPDLDVLETVCLSDPNLRTVTPTLAAAMAADIGIVQGTGVPCMVSLGQFMCHARIVGFVSRPDRRLEAKYGSELYPGIAMIRESTNEDVWHKMTRRTVMIAEALACELGKAPRTTRPAALQDARDALGTRSVEPAPLPTMITPIPKAVKDLLRMTDGQPPRTRNILLYGPPGTGKTWLVTHFATYFLLSHNVSPTKADEYWQAVIGKDEQAVRALQTEARAGTARYWSVCEDKTAFDWTWESLAEMGQGFYDDHGIAGSPPPQEGDFVFGYRSGVRQYVALARVTQGLHTREKDGQAVKSARLGNAVMLAQPVPLQLVQADSRVKPPSQLVAGMHKPIFALAPEDAAALTKAVETANPTGLPEGFGESFLEFVTFHQSFTYEEFVEGIRPQARPDGGVDYRVRPGVFRRICERAEQQPGKRFLLIIDEINRANIAKVLGELITLIEDDKRLGQPNEVRVTLPYSGEKFGVPPNLTILGTLNTADRSIALLDSALRRRFTFVEMPPDPSLLPADVEGVNLPALLTRLNKRVEALLDPDHRIGHSYLMGVGMADDLHFAWYRRVVPLLQEYFYHDGERLQRVLGKAFVREVVTDADTREALGGMAEEGARYEVAPPLEGETFLAALRNIAG